MHILTRCLIALALAWQGLAWAGATRLIDIEARLRGQPEAAAQALQALADSLPAGSTEHTEVLFARGLLLVRLGEAEPVERAAQALAASTPPGQPGAAQAQALAQALRAHWMGRHGSLGTADRQLADALASLGDVTPGLRLRLLAVQARIKELRGQLDAAVALHQQAVLLADTQSPPWRRAEMRSALAYVLAQAQQLPAARGVDEEALKLAEASGDSLALSQALTTHSILLGARGEAAAELQALQGAIDHARRAGARQDELLGLANLADHYLKHGDYTTALHLSNEALPLARAMRDPVIESVALTNAGLALISLKQRDSGMALVREALLLEERAGGLTAMAQVQREAGMYLERAGYLPEAWASFIDHRRLADEVFRREHQQALLETQAAFDHERRQRDLALLATEKGLGEARLQSRTLQQRLWAVGAVAGVLLLAVVATLLHRLWRSNIALRRSTRQLQVANEQDPLTGLSNRRHLLRVLARATPGAGLVGSLMLIDIDHFKRINDQHGHAAGDAVLVEVARRLRAALRQEDLVVRWGGEEFVALLRGLSADELATLAERVLHGIGSQPVLHDGHALAVTASIGFASFPLLPDHRPLHWERAIDVVDSAMYLAKAHGRNGAWGVRSWRRDAHIGADGAADGAGAAVDIASPMANTLEAAWHAGLAVLSQHPGPRQPDADRPTGAPPAAAPAPAGSASASASASADANSTATSTAKTATTTAATTATIAAALALLLGCALGLAPAPAQAAPASAGPPGASLPTAATPRTPAPAAGVGLAAWQAQAAAQVEAGFDRPDEALDQLARWQAATQPGSHMWQTLETARGLVLARAGRHAEADAMAQRLAAGKTTLAQADAALVQAASQDVAGQSRLSRQRSEDALALYQAACSTMPADPGCDHRHPWRARHMLARLLMTQGQASLARDQAQQAATWARQHHDIESQALALATAARASELLGERDAADRQFEQAQRLARMAGSAALRARMALAETVHRASRGDHDGSRRAAEQGLFWARQARSPRLEAMLLTNLSDSYLHAQQPRLALQAVASALPVLRAHGDRRAERILLVNASLARIGLGDLAAARATLEELQAAFRDAGASADQAQLLREFSNALAAAGDLRGALDLYHREREIAANLMAANRETALAELRERFNREAQQRQLDQLKRENALIAAQLGNRSAQQQLWAAAAAVLVLAALLVGLVYSRVRQLNRRLASNHDRLRQQSLHDPLTGLANRRAVAARLPGSCSGALLLVDIDHFKRINDSHGHAGGDAVLQALALRLQACVREGDLVARWGGEEFLIHAPALDAEGSAALAQRVLQAVSAHPVAVAGAAVPVTASVGHGHFPLPEAPGPMPLDRAVNLVDLALYAAKNQGRNAAVSVPAALSREASAPRPAEPARATATPTA